MYRVIIVDDEMPAAKLLKSYIDNYVDSFEVVEIFEDGADAVRYLAGDNSVDVIMTDIKMRNMSGVELAKYVYDMKLDIEVILVSAYADFEYAREAMRYNVFGYLLKVVDIDELIKIMGDLKENLDSKNKNDPEDIHIQRECFIENLLLGGFTDVEEMRSELDKCVFEAEGNKLLCTVLKICFEPSDDFNNRLSRDGDEKTEASIIGIVKLALNKNFVDCAFHQFNIYYIVFIDENGSADVEMLGRVIKEFFAVSVDVKRLMSGNFEEFMKMPDCLREINRENSISDQSEDSDKEKTVKIAVDYVNETLKHNLKRDISRDSVAREVGLAPSYFGKVFKSVMGVTFSYYVYEQRMKFAQKLLSSGMKTGEVCERIGYLDERHFRRVFKGYSGITPAEYRRSKGRTEGNKLD